MFTGYEGYDCSTCTITGCGGGGGTTIAGRIVEQVGGKWVAWQNSLASACSVCTSDSSSYSCPGANNLRLEFYRSDGTKIGDGWANDCNPQPYYAIAVDSVGSNITWTAKVVGLPSNYTCDFFTFGGNTYSDTNGDCQEDIPEVNAASGIWAYVKLKDATPPVCSTWTFSPTSPSNTNSLYVKSTATDNVSMLKSALYVSRNSDGSSGNWQAIGSEKTFGSGTTSAFVDGTVDFSTFGNGTYKFASNWWDSAGNPYTQCTQNFVVDKTPPVCGTWTFTPASPSGANSVSITARASDAGVGLFRRGLYISPTPGSSATFGAIPNNDTFTATNSASKSYTWNTSSLQNGTYNIAANWWDGTSSGNVGGFPGNFIQCKTTYTISKTPPTATISVPAQVCINKTQSVGMTANAVNGIDKAYFTYSPTTSASWKSPKPLDVSGLSGNSYSGSRSITFNSTNGFSVGNNYYFASGAYDDLGNKCTGNPFYFPTPGLSGWSDCGSTSRQTVNVIDKPVAVTNLRGVNPHPTIVTFRWDYAGLPITSYTISGPGTPWGTSFCNSSVGLINFFLIVWLLGKLKVSLWETSNK